MLGFYLSPDGSTVTGPFTLPVLRKMLARHEISKTTLASMGEGSPWVPLSDCCPAVFSKPASAKQRALLSYLGHPDPEAATSAEASHFIEQAGESDEGYERLCRWNVDRVTLHPELYKAQAREFRENRARDICEHCNAWKEEIAFLDPSAWPLKKLTIKQCAAAVQWLDDHSAGWDATLRESETQINHDLIEATFFDALRRTDPSAFRKGRAEATPPPPPVARTASPRQPAQPARKSHVPFAAVIGVVVLVLLLLLSNIVASCQRRAAVKENLASPPAAAR
jgi:hypothetical protein